MFLSAIKHLAAKILQLWFCERMWKGMHGNLKFYQLGTGGHRAAACVITSFKLITSWGKRVQVCNRKRAFCCCMFVRKLVNTTTIAVEYYKRSESTASKFQVMLGELLPIINIFWVGSQNLNVSERKKSSKTFKGINLYIKYMHFSY